jgi:hypothetical protein
VQLCNTSEASGLELGNFQAQEHAARISVSIPEKSLGEAENWIHNKSPGLTYYDLYTSAWRGRDERDHGCRQLRPWGHGQTAP